MRDKHLGAVLVGAFSLAFASIACGSSTEGDQLVRSLVAPTSQGQTSRTAAPQETPIAETNTPAPTPTSEIEGMVKEGTHLVGVDIQPGIYVGLAGDGLLDSCYWARLRNLTGSDDILANDNAQGLYYVEVLSEDKALETGCELLPIDQVPARDELLTILTPGTYLLGRDIEDGTYRGEAGTDILESCSWARLSNVSGEDDILANDNATGQYFIEVLPGDFGLTVGCEVEKIE
jgi:hypothetical protein